MTSETVQESAGGGPARGGSEVQPNARAADGNNSDNKACLHRTPPHPVPLSFCLIVCGPQGRLSDPGNQRKAEPRADLQRAPWVLNQSSSSRASASEERKELWGWACPPAERCFSQGPPRQPAQAPGGPAEPLTKGRAASGRHTNPQPAAFGIFSNLKPRLLLVSEGLLLPLGTARAREPWPPSSHTCANTELSPNQRGRIKAPRLINGRQFLSWTAWSCLSLLISWEENLA